MTRGTAVAVGRRWNRRRGSLPYRLSLKVLVAITFACPLRASVDLHVIFGSCASLAACARPHQLDRRRAPYECLPLAMRLGLGLASTPPTRADTRGAPWMSIPARGCVHKSRTALSTEAASATRARVFRKTRCPATRPSPQHRVRLGLGASAVRQAAGPATGLRSPEAPRLARTARRWVAGSGRNLSRGVSHSLRRSGREDGLSLLASPEQLLDSVHERHGANVRPRDRFRHRARYPHEAPERAGLPRTARPLGGCPCGSDDDGASRSPGRLPRVSVPT
jgi:hypothetical protein